MDTIDNFDGPRFHGVKGTFDGIPRKPNEGLANSLSSLNIRLKTQRMAKESFSGRVWLSIAGGELLLGVLAIFLGWLTKTNPREHIPALEDGNAILRWTLWGLAAAIPPIAVVVGMDYLPFGFIRSLTDRAHEMVLGFFRNLSIPQLFTISIAAGACEELLFRGWLQCLLAGGTDMAMWGPWRLSIAIAISAVIFGLCHFISVPYFIFATAFGVYAGAVYYWSGTLWVPITVHTFYDTAILLWLIRWRKKRLDNDSQPS